MVQGFKNTSNKMAKCFFFRQSISSGNSASSGGNSNGNEDGNNKGERISMDKENRWTTNEHGILHGLQKLMDDQITCLENMQCCYEY